MLVRTRRQPTTRYQKPLIRPESHEEYKFGTITLCKLARRMQRVPVDTLRPVVEGGHLKVVKTYCPHKGENFGDTLVEHPSPAVMIWLREMLTPMTMRPLIKLREVADMLLLKPMELKRRCIEKGLKFHFDRVFGELLSPRDLGKLLRSGIIPTSHGLARFDRLALIQFLIGEPTGPNMKFQITPYSVQLDREVRRIARMKEPDRTFRAVALMEALKDAGSIVECLKDYRERLKSEEVKAATQTVQNLLSDISRVAT